jgi:hypothetical protein
MVAIGALLMVGSNSSSTLARAGAGFGGSASSAPSNNQRTAAFP